MYQQKIKDGKLPIYIPENSVTNNVISPYSIIGPTDDRSLVTNTYLYPYRAIAFLEITWSNGQTTIGTGFFVGPDQVVTNAHVIYNNSRGGEAVNITVTPGKNGVNSPIGSTYAIASYCPDAFKNETSYTLTASRNDWAVMVVAESFGNTYGWLNLYTDGGLTIGETGQDFYLSGYPANVSHNENYDDYRTDELDAHKNGYQYCARGKILTIPNVNMYSHNIDALAGNSGSPIYFYRDNTAQVVGIYQGSATDHSTNYAVRISIAIKNMILSF